MVVKKKNRIFISTTCFLYNVLENPEKIPDFVEGIELSGNFPFYRMERLEKLLDVFSKRSDFLIHGYFPAPEESFILTFSSKDKSLTEKAFALAEKAFRLCKKYNVPYYSFHPGFLFDGYAKPNGHFAFHMKTGISYEEALLTFVENFNILHEIAGKYGIALVVENLFENDSILGGDGKRSSLNCSFEEFDDILGRLPSDTGILLDLGHLNISANYLGFSRCNYIDRLIGKYGDRIYELHLSSNNGFFDEHLPIAEDDWQMGELKKISVCPGTNGTGLNITVEARKCDDNVLEKIMDLIQNRLS
ncbi:MAG: TIM barrel protein [Victivallales bacterium]